jgi:ABC-type polysaccharide/polyol phosphate transport system ATPase subunit
MVWMIDKGDKVGIIGQNGAGKSTPFEGSVTDC